MKIHESAENYLETILVLYRRNGQVRSVDIVNEMNFTKPSISHAMKQFRESGYINMDEDGFISLTKTGMEIAERVYERHQLLTEFLLALGVNKESALEDACKIEHDISQISFDAIKGYFNKHLAK